MSKSSMSLLRGYCLFNEMRIYMKIFAQDNVEVQKTVRTLDKKSNYVFPLIEPPVLEDTEETDKEKKTKQNKNLEEMEAQAI